MFVWPDNEDIAERQAAFLSFPDAVRASRSLTCLVDSVARSSRSNANPRTLRVISCKPSPSEIAAPDVEYSAALRMVRKKVKRVWVCDE
jgi:hypothetical protein